MRVLKSKNIYTKILRLFLLGSVIALAACKLTSETAYIQHSREPIKLEVEAHTAVTDAMIQVAETTSYYNFLVTKLRELQADNKSKINEVDPRGFTALHYAILGEPAIITVLCRLGANVEAETTSFNVRSLHLAALWNKPGAVQALLNHPNIHVDARDTEGRTPLYIAVFTGHPAIVQALLKNSAVNVNAKDNKGSTPLHVAALLGYVEIAQALLKNSAINVNAKDNKGSTPLHVAAFMCQVDIFSILLKNPNINIHVQDIKGRTPLYIAALEGHADILHAFLDHCKQSQY